MGKGIEIKKYYISLDISYLLFHYCSFLFPSYPFSLSLLSTNILLTITFPNSTYFNSRKEIIYTTTFALVSSVVRVALRWLLAAAVCLGARRVFIGGSVLIGGGGGGGSGLVGSWGVLIGSWGGDNWGRLISSWGVLVGSWGGGSWGGLVGGWGRDSRVGIVGSWGGGNWSRLISSWGVLVGSWGGGSWGGLISSWGVLVGSWAGGSGV